MQKDQAKRAVTLTLSIAAIVVLCVLLWYLRLHYLYGPSDYRLVTSKTGEWDLSGVDFSAEYVRVWGDVAYIPGELLTPGEFAAGEDRIRYGSTDDDPVNTARVRIRFPDNTVYMLMTHSVDFAEHIYINGELRQDVGIVGRTAEETTEGFALLCFEVQPVDGWVELVRQSANFAHRDNGSSDDIRVGRPQRIKRLISLQTDLTAFVMGLFFALCVAHCMLYVLLRRYRANLYFALLCLVMALRVGVTYHKVVSAWFPSIPWEVLYRLECLTLPAASLLILLVVREVFPNTLPRRFTAGMGALFSLLMLLCLLLPTYPLSYCVVAAQLCLTACALFLSIYLSLRMRRLPREDTLWEAQRVTLVGLWFLTLAVVNDGMYYGNLLGVRYVLNDLVLMILAFLLMGAVFSATLRQAAEATARERRMADEKNLLEELNQRRSAFYTEISHEIKTPLTVIAANAQFVAGSFRNGQMDEETGADLDAISGEAKRLAQMVTGLVSLGRMQATHSEAAPLPLESMVGDTARMYGALSGKRGNTIAVDTPPGLPPVRGDADQLSQVLLNLLQNANRHTRDGQITVAVQKTGGMARVSVSDTGEGIPPELLPRVFDRFVRGDTGGTGLGLPICRAIVQAHGGDMGIESEMGAGTTVWFTLPLEEVADDQ